MDTLITTQRSVTLFVILTIHCLSLEAAATLPENYEQQRGCDKQAFLWKERILPTEYGQKPGLNFAGWKAELRNSLKVPRTLASLGQTFDNVSDEMPVVRGKIVHRFGSVATVVFRSSGNHHFTGVFAAAEACGLARLSIAGPPLALGFVPGMALKFFIDGKPSVNIEVLNSLEGQGSDWNFFSRPLTNSLPKVRIALLDPKTWVLKAFEQALATVKPAPLYLPVTPFAHNSPEGRKVEHPSSPMIIVFVPCETPNALFRRNEDRDFRDVLAAIPVGTKIYDVYGLLSSGERVLIGTLETTSRFVSSQFGDEKLFFRHNR